MATAPSFVGTPRLGSAQIANADGVTAKDVITAGASGTKITSILATNTDGTNRNVILQIVRATTQAGTYQLTFLQINASAGNINTTPSFNLLINIPGLPIDNDGNPYLFLQSGDKIQALLDAGAVTAGKLISVLAIGGDF